MEDQRMGERAQRVKLEFDGISENEEFARVTAAVFMSRLDPTLEEVEDVRTAVSEAVTNAVIHGYRGEGGLVVMELTAKDGAEPEICVSVRDEGVGIPDVKKAMEPMYTTDPSGERSGMGFSFMEAFMDEVRVQSRVGEGTLVVMRKKIGR